MLLDPSSILGASTTFALLATDTTWLNADQKPKAGSFIFGNETFIALLATEATLTKRNLGNSGNNEDL